ncbi:hypothetical protein [Empedobacter brevis]|uniref:hypothetical protein n=1 Tax=Empedobacter brevis TaxID=247 RepID=UPI0039AFF4CF
MKLYLNILFISFASFASVQAQVGVNTNKPTKILDVNGDLNLRKELRLGGNDQTLGDAGKVNQVLQVADDADNHNTWRTYKVADGTGSLSLYYLKTTVDRKGLYFNKTGDTNPYKANDNSSGWTFMEGNVDSFVVTDGSGASKVVLSFQTTAQINRGSNSSGTSASFACGIFMKRNNGSFQLKAVRSDVVIGNPGAYKIFNLNATIEELEQGSYEVKAACRNRQLGSGRSLVNLGIGRPVDTNTLNQEMANTILTTTLLHPYQ